jgi:hypothetical protein
MSFSSSGVVPSGGLEGYFSFGYSTDIGSVITSSSMDLAEGSPYFVAHRNMTITGLSAGFNFSSYPALVPPPLNITIRIVKGVQAPSATPFSSTTSLALSWIDQTSAAYSTTGGILNVNAGDYVAMICSIIGGSGPISSGTIVTFFGSITYV